MNGVIGDLLPLALGVAISPIPIIAAILMLFSPRAAGTSSGFLVGWIAGIVVVTAIFTALSGSLESAGEPSAAPVPDADQQQQDSEDDLRPGRRGGEHATPKWMTAIDSFTPVKSLGLGFLLSAVNPKNLLMGCLLYTSPSPRDGLLSRM